MQSITNRADGHIPAPFPFPDEWEAVRANGNARYGMTWTVGQVPSDHGVVIGQTDARVDRSSTRPANLTSVKIEEDGGRLEMEDAWARRMVSALKKREQRVKVAGKMDDDMKKKKKTNKKKEKQNNNNNQKNLGKLERNLQNRYGAKDGLVIGVLEVALDAKFRQMMAKLE